MQNFNFVEWAGNSKPRTTTSDFFRVPTMVDDGGGGVLVPGPAHIGALCNCQSEIIPRQFTTLPQSNVPFPCSSSVCTRHVDTETITVATETGETTSYPTPTQ